MDGTERETSPDGRFEATYRLSEKMKGQWVATPQVRDLRESAVILALADDSLDGTVNWGAQPGRFSLALRRWPGKAGGLTARFDADAGTVRLGEGSEARPIAEAEALIADHFAAQEAAAISAAMRARAEPSTRARLAGAAEWAGIALFLLAGLAVMLGWPG